MVTPINKKKKWYECIDNNRTITIKHGCIQHLFTNNILPDRTQQKDIKTNSYLETYFLDEQSQLEKRIAIGDSTFINHVSPENKELMKQIIKDVQNQLLTHNGFVTEIKKYRKKINKKISDRLTQKENEFDSEHFSQFKLNKEQQDLLMNMDLEEDIDSSDDENETPDILSKIPLDNDQIKVFRKLMLEKRKFLHEQREIIEKELIGNIDLAMKKPFKNPTTIQERTYNDPRSGVPISWISNDSRDKDKYSFYKTSADPNDDQLQAVHEISAEYDLLSYPLFFPFGNKTRHGWTTKIPKVLKKEELVNHEYKKLKKEIPKSQRKKIKTMSEKVNVIKRILKLEKLTPSDYEYEHRVDSTHPNVTPTQWYNFKFFERAGMLKPQVFSPEKSLHEYNKSCESKLKNHTNKEKRYTCPTNDEEIYKHPVNFNGKKYDLKVHPHSRIPYILENGEMKPIPVNTSGNNSELREPQKKNPILYGDRLKLFYLCDQGLKVDNNNLRNFERPQVQKRLRQMKFRKVNKLHQLKQPVSENDGKPLYINHTHKKSKRWFKRRYEKAIAAALACHGADLFITVTGSDLVPEVRRLMGVRKSGTCPELTNRVFQIKLRALLDDIMKKQIFGRVIGNIWVIEYQKRYF